MDFLKLTCAQGTRTLIPQEPGELPSDLFGLDGSGDGDLESTRKFLGHIINTTS